MCTQYLHQRRVHLEDSFIIILIIKKVKCLELGVVVHSYNPSIGMAEAGVWGQPGPHNETLSQKNENYNNNNRSYVCLKHCELYFLHRPFLC
jgi:hypothetical protein